MKRSHSLQGTAAPSLNAPMKGYGLLSYSYGIYQKLHRKPTSDNPLIGFVNEGLELAPVILHLFKLDNIRLTDADDIALASRNPSEEEILRAQAWLARFPMLKSSLDTGSPLVFNFVYKDDKNKIKDFGLNLTKTGNSFDITIITSSLDIEYYMAWLSMDSQMQFTENFILNKVLEYKGAKTKAQFSIDMLNEGITYLMTKSILPNAILKNPFKRKAFMEILVGRKNTLGVDAQLKISEDVGNIFRKAVPLSHIRTLFKILFEIQSQIESLLGLLASNKSNTFVQSKITFMNEMFNQLFIILSASIEMDTLLFPVAPDALLRKIFLRVDGETLSIATEFLNGTRTAEDLATSSLKNPTQAFQYTSITKRAEDFSSSILDGDARKLESARYFYISQLSKLSETTRYGGDFGDNAAAVISYKDESTHLEDQNTRLARTLTDASFVVMFNLITPLLFTNIKADMCSQLAEDISEECNNTALTTLFSEVASVNQDIKTISTAVFNATDTYQMSFMSTTSKVVSAVLISAAIAYGAHRIIKSTKKNKNLLEK